MKWHLEDVPFILSTLPHALHDLIHREDKVLVRKVQSVKVAPVASDRHHSLNLDFAEDSSEPSSRISVEKTLDPVALRSTQNIGLLLHDYINQLPGAELPGEEGESLLKHWQDLMLDHPERLANVHASHWHEQRCQQFLRDILEHRHGRPASPEEFTAAWEDWQRASAAGNNVGMDTARQQKMNYNKWQDLVMRTRLHYIRQKIDTGYTPNGLNF